MAVFRWGQAWDESFRNLEREVDRLLQGVNFSLQGVRFGRPYPALNLYELPDEFLTDCSVGAVNLLPHFTKARIVRRAACYDGAANQFHRPRTLVPRGCAESQLEPVCA